MTSHFTMTQKRMLLTRRHPFLYQIVIVVYVLRWCELAVLARLWMRLGQNMLKIKTLGANLAIGFNQLIGKSSGFFKGST